jgi:GT2 family glycosyltransferase
VPYEVVVVDNASRVETRAWLEEQPDLRLVLNEENHLWCAGINQAMEMADPRSRALLLLNPDVEILSDRWLEVLLHHLDSDARVGVVGTTHRYSPLGPVHGWIDGCCFLARREALEEVGPFDAARFPWSGGPALWTIRAWKAGWSYRVVHRRDRLLVHHQHRSIEDQDAAARRSPAAFRMPVSFEALLREEGVAMTRPTPPRRLLERHFRPARRIGRFYAAGPVGHRLPMGAYAFRASSG